MVDLFVTNSRVTVTNAPAHLLSMLDKRMRFATQLADLEVDGLPVIEGWDGWVRLLRKPRRSPPWFPAGLLSIAYDCVHELNLAPYVRITDQRVRPSGDVPDYADLELRDYQLEAVQAAITGGRGVIWLPPRGGKTRILCEIVRQLALPTIWTAPTDAIAKQTLAVFDEFMGPNYAIHQIGTQGQDRTSKAKVVIATDATASELSQEFYASREVIVVDEFHHAASARYKKIFGKIDHVYYRFGTTGTFFRSGGDDLAMHAHLSNVLYRLDEISLKDRGYLVPVQALIVKTNFKRLMGVGGLSWIAGAGKLGIHEHVGRNRLVADTALMLYQEGRSVLIMVRTKRQGRQIRENLVDSLTVPVSGSEFGVCEFISTDMPRDVQRRLLQAFNERKVQILIGTSLIGEGVDLPSADALVFASGGKGGVSLTQAMYRICTASEGKNRGILIDFADSHNAMLLRHTMSRLETYYHNPIFDVDVV